MAELEYEQQLMLKEYESLRAELLQVFDQQNRLVFITGITVVAFIIGSFTEIAAGLPATLPPVLAVLAGLCVKSIANYNRIFRIGSYLAVVHEQRGSLEASLPRQDQAGWHTRWRRVARGRMIRWKGGGGSRAEAWFLGLLGVSACVLVIGDWKELFFEEPWHVVLVSASGVLALVVVFLAVKLAKIGRVSEEYEQAFRREFLKSQKQRGVNAQE